MTMNNESAENFHNMEKVGGFLFLKHRTKNEITIIIRKLMKNLLYLPHRISATTLKTINEFIILPGNHIINMYFTSGQSPNQWT